MTVTRFYKRQKAKIDVCSLCLMSSKQTPRYANESLPPAIDKCYAWRFVRWQKTQAGRGAAFRACFVKTARGVHSKSILIYFITHLTARFSTLTVQCTQRCAQHKWGEQPLILHLWRLRDRISLRCCALKSARRFSFDTRTQQGFSAAETQEQGVAGFLRLHISTKLWLWGSRSLIKC